MSDVLRTDALSVAYGGVRALVEADVRVGPGQVVGLIGPNGAGKTTFIDAVCGFTRATGRVWLNGEDVSGLSPHRRARAGLGRTWQAADLFDDLTVAENLAVAARPTFRRRRDDAGDPAMVLSRLGLDGAADHATTELSQGQRKLVGVARALVAEPAVLCLDEPAAGLDTDESRELGQRLRALADAGTAMLLVDHDMGLVLSVCDEVVVLDFGRVIARGTPGEVRADRTVIEAYLGSAAGAVESYLEGA
jgi:branched-chain amino acid transport system ATP-binding protein